MNLLVRVGLVASLACWILPAHGAAEVAPAARPAPGFVLESTTGAVRSRASYAGRVALLMYEDRDSGEVNAALKAEVKERMDREGLAGEVVVVPIADLRAYDYWPVRNIVRAAVLDRARSLGVEILLDWKGDVVRDYGFRTPGSNVALLGRDGSLRFFHAGALDAPLRRRFQAALSAALAPAAASAALAPRERGQ